MSTPFPSIPISQTSARTTSNDINAARFGNGYEQRVPMGLHYQRDRWSVSFDALSVAQKNTVVAFIQAISNGSVCTWTTPLDVAEKKFVLDGDWSITNRGGNVWAISFNLRQVYDLT